MPTSLDQVSVVQPHTIATITNTEVTQINNCHLHKRVWTIPLVVKVDLHLLPLFCLFYIICSLDRASVEFAKLSGLIANLGMSNKEQTEWAVATYYFCVIIFDIPSNLILRNWKPAFWMGIIMGAWGIISISMAACSSFNGIVIARFVQSLFEAGFFPGMIYYLSFWYTRKEFGTRVGVVWACRCFAGAVGGLFAYGVNCINSNDKQIHVWQWAFILQGIPCIVLAIVTSWYLPFNPGSAPFLLPEESKLVDEKVEADTILLNESDWSWEQVGSVFLDLKMYAYIIIYFLGAACLQSITLYLPIVVEKLNPSANVLQSQLYLLPPYILAMIFTIALCISSDHFVDRSSHIIFINLIAAISLVVQICLHPSETLGTYVMICIAAASIYAHVAIKVVWIANNFVGFTRRAVALGTIVSIGSVGSAVGSQIINDQSKFTLASIIILVLLILQSLVALLIRLVFSREIQRRSALDIEDQRYQMYKFGGHDLAGDRHPNFRYIL